MLAFVAACAAASPPAVPFDWKTWGDGQAEVASYTLTQPRYGHLYEGVATLIFVTEDFSFEARVKADPGAHPASDLRKVMKLHEARDFRTGIYDYAVATSTFVRLEAGDGMRALDPLKIAFSASEWCGIVYDELIDSRLTSHTYFDSDDGPPRDLPLPAGIVYGDAVPVLVRGFLGDWLADGEKRTVPYLPRFIDARFAHTPLAVERATVSRAGGAYTVAVGGTTTTWRMEKGRIAGWESSTGEKAVLRGVDRLPYWNLHNPGDESARSRIGL